MSEASRLPLSVMVGFSLLLHGLFITGVPQLFDRTPDVYRLTRYVVRFAQPVPTVVPMLAQVAVADPVAIEPAQVEPVSELQTPKPMERVATLPEHAVETLVAPALVQPVVPKPPELQQRAATQTRQRVETQPEHVAKPQVAPAVAQPVVLKPPEVRQRVAEQVRQRVETPTEHVAKLQVAPAVAQPVVSKPPEVRQRVAARARQRVETPTEHVVKPQAAPAVVKPVIAKPQERRQHRTAARRERVVVQAHQPRPEIVAVDPALQPVVVKPVSRRRAARAPRSRTATRTTGRQVPSRAAAVVPQAVSAVSNRVAALPKPRQPSREAILQAERERFQAEQEQFLAERAAFDNYKALVQQRLEVHSLYLQDVTERVGKNGRVVLHFTVCRDGEVIIDPDDVEFTHRTFRSAALRVLRRVGQLPPLPSAIRRQQIRIEVPINFQFRLEDR